MIRKATEADIEAVARIYEHIHAKERLGTVCIGWIPGIYPTKATAETALKRGDLFVYEADGEVTAAAIINQEQVDVYTDCHWKYAAVEKEVMVIHTLVVEPLAAARGIGKAFIAFYEEYARAAGCKVLRLDTNAKNAVARGFYAKLGYREAGILPCDFNGIPSIELVLLEKPLV